MKKPASCWLFRVCYSFMTEVRKTWPNFGREETIVPLNFTLSYFVVEDDNEMAGEMKKTSQCYRLKWASNN